MNNVAIIPPKALAFAQNIVICCDLIRKIMVEFSNFKKPLRIRQMIVELSDLEEKCDAIYLDAMQTAYQHGNDLGEILAWREIYEALENCADACEHVGDCIETVIMKNT